MTVTPQFEDVLIEADELEIGSDVLIEPGVRINARQVRIGSGTRIERGTSVQGLGDRMECFVLGEQSFLGFASQIMTPNFSMGDYSQLHNSGLHTGYKSLSIGHNCWIGQNTILNCTERLSIANNVRIGTQSQLWTHVASGELLEGCTLFGEDPLVLQDNVWIVGGAVISPGLILANNCIIMTGSVLTKSTEAYHTYAGVPARDVTDRLNFWKPLTLHDKIAAMRTYLEEFYESVPEYAGQARFAGESDSVRQGDVVITADNPDWNLARREKISLFDISSKTYLKQRSAVEISLMRFLVGYRARFIPIS